MLRLIGLPVLFTDANFATEDGYEGKIYNKSADEWQDRTRHREWEGEMRARGAITDVSPGPSRRRERGEKIADKITKYGPGYAKAQRLQYQQGSERNRLDIVD